MSTPKLRYLQDLERDDFAADSAQKNAIEHLDELYQRLVATAASSNKKNITTFFKRFFGSAKPCQQGLYLWGGVGRGKTYLMDSFLRRYPLSVRCESIFTALCAVFTVISRIQRLCKSLGESGRKNCG